MLARIRKSMEEKDRGFTLIELLVVMIIIGILAAIAIPVFLNQRQKAVDTSIKSDLRTAANSAETKYVDSQTYPGTAGTYSDAATTLGITVSNGDTIRYAPTTDGLGYCIYGWNAKSDATGTSGGYYWYVSKSGGLQAGTPTTTTPTGCPTAA